MTPPVTQRFAKFVADTDYSDISPKAIQNAKLHILDTLGVTLAGYEHPVANIVLDYCKVMGGTPDVTILGSNQKTSVPMGAFANGLLAHAIDYDDWDAVARVGHPSCMNVAASLSTGEATGASGKDFLRAYVVGIEIATQMAAACPDIIKRGFHSTPIYGSMGAAAAVFDLLPVGAKVVLADDCYQAVSGLATAGEERGRWGVERVGVEDTARWIELGAGADLIWLESPSNPLLRVADLPTICAAPRSANALVVIDSTFATPLVQRPLELGADLVMHSATKYLGGHSDLLLGAVVASTPERAHQLR